MSRRTHVAAVAGTLLSWVSLSVVQAQPLVLTRDSNINSLDTRSTIAPALPTPPIPSADPPDLFLTSARRAVMAGRTGEAQEALERAETRLLDRATSQAQASLPDREPAVVAIMSARRSLAAHDQAATLVAIDEALAAPAPVITAEQIAAMAGAAAGGQASTELVARDATLLPPPPAPAPVITRALLPGHWTLDGADYVWVPPETALRTVETAERVPGTYVWRDGAYVWVPTHYAR